MNIYDMKLHDVLWLHLNNTEVLRVPGGWVYRVYDSGTQRECLHSCFVPFDNQFVETSNTAELAATDNQQPQLEMPCESDFMAWCGIQHYNLSDAASIYRYIARHIKRVR